MYERFTDRARKIMQLANYEAQRFGHEKIDSLHILWSILEEGNGVANFALNIMNGVDQHAIKCNIRNRRGISQKNESAKGVIGKSIDLVRRGCYNYVGSEHIFGALLEYDCAAGRFLESQGIKKKEYWGAVNDLLERDLSDGFDPGLPKPKDMPKREMPSSLETAVIVCDFNPIDPKDLELDIFSVNSEGVYRPMDKKKEVRRST